MSRANRASSRTSTLVILLVVILVAGMAYWFGFKTASTGEQSPPQIQHQPKAASPDTNDSATASSTVADRTTTAPKERTSFLSQEGLASIPADRFFTTSAMNGLNPSDPVTTFRPGDPVYIYAGIHAPSNERIQIRWFGPDGSHVLPSIYKNISSNTGAVGYRIYSYRIFREPGEYSVRLYNSAGTVIGETGFEVQE